MRPPSYGACDAVWELHGRGDRHNSLQFVMESMCSNAVFFWSICFRRHRAFWLFSCYVVVVYGGFTARWSFVSLFYGTGIRQTETPTSQTNDMRTRWSVLSILLLLPTLFFVFDTACLTR